ncbi:elongation factor P [Candidatus Parcubacteria bacterium]|nr:elongation factor P [Candidatus Parcubacteria bacterium]
MLQLSDIRPGATCLLDGDPFEVLEAQHVQLGRGGAILNTKLRNLRRGTTMRRTFKGNDTVPEANVEKRAAQFLYRHRGEYWFANPKNPKERFQLTAEQLGDLTQWLIPKLKVEALVFEEEILSAELPIKVDYTVLDAPPGLKGDTAQGGTKTVTLESGATILTPLFIETGDVVRVNTRTGEYVERISRRQ